MKALRKYYVIAKVSFTNALAYRASVFSRFGFFTLYIYVFMSLWRAIYQEGAVHGYSYAQMVWYLIMTEFVSFFCGAEILQKMNEEVKSGSIAYLLGRPSHYIFYQLANSLGQVPLNFVSFGALATVLGLLFVGPLHSFTPLELAPLLLSILLSILLNFFFLTLIGLTAFVLEDNLALYLIYQKLSFMLGMFLPVEFLPAWLQPVAKNLPFSYIYWAPAKIFVNYSPALCLELIPRQAAWAAAAAAAALLCYQLSIRRLQVNGG
ncbi:MAG: ABC-2 family transporter protein [Clostridiales bacterium]|nr:ABC-2 family transporter protein [Clostridiales bacterium]